MIEAIEEREREERIRQGYLPPPDDLSGVGGGKVAGQIAGPSDTSRHSGMRYHLGASGSGSVAGAVKTGAGGGGSRINARPSFVDPSASASSGSATSATQQQQSQTPPPQTPQTHTSSQPFTPTPRAAQSSPGSYEVPTSTSPGVAAPAHTVDPTKYNSPEELRRLAEEDTRRRMQGNHSVPSSPGAGAMPYPPTAGGTGPAASSSKIKPRRRGAAA